ncbi:ATPase PAAT isoform X1 [Clupea harengus]|uniref:ATPase PAAT isoform X1 n=1 Tax=Clupea harengus TaxID=7950 RepID=A0A6P3VXX7_CLUHA|nr:ATPase PAAT isoform X1 [Clupea harengus]
MSEQMKTSKDGVISGSISWVSRLEDCHICDVIKTHQEGNLQQVDTEVQSNNAPQYLEQVDATPCVITLQCVPHCRSVITSLLVVSEARTMEVYSASGDYCGTCRGEQDSNVNCDGVTDSRPFYRKHLKLECPTTSCEVKLLSLGGRASVGIAGIHVALRVLEAEGKQEVGTGGSIDLKQVQTMMEEMGTTLSPGAQHLMDMVQFQQKSKADAMAGFLPLLMAGGGVLSCLTKGASVSLPLSGPPPPPSLSAPQDNASLTETSAQGDYGHRSCQAPTSSPSPRSTLLPTPAPLPAGLSQGKLQEVMSALMRAPPGQHCAATPDLLPLLQSVCCQVAQLRMDDTTAATIAQGKAHMPNGPSEVHPCCRGLEEVLEKRLQQMEDRLREHMDQRLDSLEQKLDTVLQQVLLPPMQPS